MNDYEESVRDAEEDFDQQMRDIAADAFNKVVKPVLLRNGASFHNADGQLRFLIGGGGLEIHPLFERGLVNYFAEGGELIVYKDSGFIDVGRVMTIEVMGTDRILLGLWMDEFDYKGVLKANMKLANNFLKMGGHAPCDTYLCLRDKLSRVFGVNALTGGVVNQMYINAEREIRRGYGEWVFNE